MTPDEEVLSPKGVLIRLKMEVKTGPMHDGLIISTGFQTAAGNGGVFLNPFAPPNLSVQDWRNLWRELPPTTSGSSNALENSSNSPQALEFTQSPMIGQQQRQQLPTKNAPKPTTIQIPPPQTSRSVSKDTDCNGEGIISQKEVNIEEKFTETTTTTTEHRPFASDVIDDRPFQTTFDDGNSPWKTRQTAYQSAGRQHPFSVETPPKQNSAASPFEQEKASTPYERTSSSSMRQQQQIPCSEQALHQGQQSTIKLNLFDNESEAGTDTPRQQQQQLVPILSRRNLPPHDGLLRRARTPNVGTNKTLGADGKEHLLSDATTTTETVEVFRSRDKFPPVEWYKLPPGPLTPSQPSEYVPVSGPRYERISRATTRFSDGPNASSTPVPYQQPQKSVQWDDRVRSESYSSSPEPEPLGVYTVQEPPSTISPKPPSIPASPRPSIVQEKGKVQKWTPLYEAYEKQASPMVEHDRFYEKEEEKKREDPETMIIRRQYQQRSVQKIVPKDNGYSQKERFNENGERREFEKAVQIPPPPPVPPVPPPRPPPRAKGQNIRQKQQLSGSPLYSQQDEQQNIFDETRERLRPPRPPKTFSRAPPRPTTRKPHRTRLYQPATARSQTLPRRLPGARMMARYPPQPPESPSYSSPWSDVGLYRSASQGELSIDSQHRYSRLTPTEPGLYKTRDCLGRVVREI